MPLDVEGVLYTRSLSFLCQKQRQKQSKLKSLKIKLWPLVLAAKNVGSWQGLWQPVEPWLAAPDCKSEFQLSVWSGCFPTVCSRSEEG